MEVREGDGTGRSGWGGGIRVGYTEQKRLGRQKERAEISSHLEGGIERTESGRQEEGRAQHDIDRVSSHGIVEEKGDIAESPPGARGVRVGG